MNGNKLFLNKFIEEACGAGLEYVSQDEVKSQIREHIVSPIFAKILQHLYPYFLGFTILFILNVLLLIVILVIIAKMRKG